MLMEWVHSMIHIRQIIHVLSNHLSHLLEMSSKVFVIRKPVWIKVFSGSGELDTQLVQLRFFHIVHGPVLFC